MNWRVPREDGPEPLPPEELLRLRARASAPPRPDTRHRHVSAAMAEARAHRSHPSGTAIAMRGARVIAGVAGIIVVTSGLAGAQILPEPARALTAVVSETLIPGFQAPEPEAEPTGGASAGEAGKPPADGGDAGTAGATVDPQDGDESRVDKQSTTSSSVPSTSTTSTPATTTSSSTSTSTTSSTSTTTTTDPSTTTTTDPSTTTTTSSTTTTPSSTTTTTAPPEEGRPPVAPAFGRGPAGPEGPGGGN